MFYRFGGKIFLSLGRAKGENALEVDFGAYDFSIPHRTLSSSIGNGVDIISKYLSSKLSGTPDGAQPLVDFPASLNYQGEECKTHSHSMKIYMHRCNS